MLNRWIFASVASVALVSVGLVHGFWTDRWSTSADTTEAAARLSHIPHDIGDWRGEDVEVKAGQVGPGVAGCLQRRYISRTTGSAVIIALVNGRPGPVATHTPEVCYGASGYLVGTKKAVDLDKKLTGAQFWTSVAVRTRVTDETKVRIYWAWNGGQGWVASADARQQFPRFRYPVLHKLYVVRDLSGTSESAGGKSTERDEVCEAFLNAFLPELDRKLFNQGERGT